MKTLLLLAFILYHFPAQAVVIDTIVCIDHDERRADVYHDVLAPDDYNYLTFEEVREIVCKRLKQLKHNTRGN
jgi:hypothetical protein